MKTSAAARRYAVGVVRIVGWGRLIGEAGRRYGYLFDGQDRARVREYPAVDDHLVFAGTRSHRERVRDHTVALPLQQQPG